MKICLKEIWARNDLLALAACTRLFQADFDPFDTPETGSS